MSSHEKALGNVLKGKNIEGKKEKSTVGCKNCGKRLVNSSSLMKHNHFVHGA